MLERFSNQRNRAAREHLGFPSCSRLRPYFSRTAHRHAYPQATRPARRRAARLLPAAQPHVRFSRRRELPADLIHIVGQDIGQEGHQRVAKGCQKLGLTARIELPGSHPYGTLQAIKHWHLTGRLGKPTHVTLDMHGKIVDGKHWVLLPEGEWMETAELVRALREGGREFGLQDWEGCIQFNVCFSGELRKYLEHVAGLHLQIGGKNPLLTRLGWYMAGRILPLLKQQKDQPQAPGSWAKALFEHVRQGAPMTVAMVGKGIATMLSHVRTPLDLQGRQVDLLDAFATRVMTGKAEHVKQFIEMDPQLLTRRCDVHPTPFSAAVYAGRWKTVVLLLDCPQLNWEEELAVLLILAQRWPGEPRLLERSLQAFERKATRMTARVQADPAQLRALMLELALDHMLCSLEDLESAAAATLARKLAQGAQVDPAFAVAWQLLARTGAAATRMGRLGHGDDAEDFLRELRQRLAVELAQPVAQPG